MTESELKVVKAKLDNGKATQAEMHKARLDHAMANVELVETLSSK